MSHKKNIFFSAVLSLTATLFITITSCSSGEEGLRGTVEIAGSSTVYPISTAVAEEFSKLHPSVVVPVRSTGTGGGFKNFFVHGKTHINDASRTIKESEKQKALENGIEPIEFQVAIDAITIVVNLESFVYELTTDELKKIWQPENPVQTWNELNPKWPEKELELYGPTSASGTFDYFTEAIMHEGGASRSDYQKTEQDNTIVQAVTGSKYALGYFGMAFYLENTSRLRAVKINGVTPSIETARTGKYSPLSRPLFIYVSKKALAQKHIATFVRFYIEQTSTQLIKDIGYVPVPEDVKEANLAKLDKILAEIKTK